MGYWGKKTCGKLTVKIFQEWMSEKFCNISNKNIKLNDEKKK